MPTSANNTHLIFDTGSQVSAPGIVLITSTTLASTANVNFTAFNNTLYSAYIIKIDNANPSSDNVEALLRFSRNAGTSWDAGATDYMHVKSQIYARGSTASASYLNSGDTEVVLLQGLGNTATEYGVSGDIIIHDPGRAEYTYVTYRLVSDNQLGANNMDRWTGSGIHKYNSAVTGVQIRASAGNWITGKMELYGVLK